MMCKFHKLLREAHIHMNQMVKNQTNFHKVSCFLVDIQIKKREWFGNLGRFLLFYAFKLKSKHRHNHPAY